jgi:hypothetical protein
MNNKSAIQEPQDDEDVAVDVGRAGRAGGRVMVQAGPLDMRPVLPGRGVVDGERQPLEAPSRPGVSEDAPSEIEGRATIRARNGPEC